MSEGIKCPRCNHRNNVVFGSYTVEENRVTVNLSCISCEIDWDRLYKKPVDVNIQEQGGEKCYHVIDDGTLEWFPPRATADDPLAEHAYYACRVCNEKIYTHNEVHSDDE